MPLKDGEGDGDADRDNGPNPSSGNGNMRRVPRTNSYYHRAGMTPRLDDMHFLANAPSFSSVATTATNVTDARLSSMASLANNSFVGRNGLPAAAMSMASTSSLHNDPRFALGRTTSAASTASAAGPAGNSSLPGGVARPLGTGNIFLQQDDTDYQNLLASIITSDGIAMAPVAAADQIPESVAATTALADGLMDLRRTKSKPNNRRLSDEGAFQLDADSRKTSHTGGIRRSSSSAISILRRGRYSNGFLASLREGQEESRNGAHDNNHNASFNNNSVMFTAPTIHLIGEEAQPDQQHLDDKEQTIENAGDFDDDEQIPECILAAFAGETPPTNAPGRRPSTCSSLSDQEQSVQDNQPKGDDCKKSEKPQQIPQEVTAVGRYYEDDELDEYLFTGIQSLQEDVEDNNPNVEAGTTSSSQKFSGHTSSRRCRSVESMSSLSTLESKRSQISQTLAR